MNSRGLLLVPLTGSRDRITSGSCRAEERTLALTARGVLRSLPRPGSHLAGEVPVAESGSQGVARAVAVITRLAESSTVDIP